MTNAGNSGVEHSDQRGSARGEEAQLSCVLSAGGLEGGLEGAAERLHVVAKRTYAVRADGVAPAEEQEPLAFEVAYYPGPEGRELPQSVDPDTLAAQKQLADIIVQGSAHSLAGPVRSLRVGVGLRRRERDSQEPEWLCLHRLAVIGDRVLDRDAMGTPVFSEPEPFEVMPVRNDRAFGGFDRWSHEVAPEPEAAWLEGVTEFAAREVSLYGYPRNRCGRGYLVSWQDQAFGQLQLPNLELPGDRLRPELLCGGSPLRWPRAVQPASLDWVDQASFSRSAYLGLAPPHDCDRKDFFEVRHQWMDGRWLTPPEDGFLFHEPNVAAFAQGAVRPLQLEAIHGDEELVLWNMHPGREELVVPLPRERPQILLELPGGEVRELEGHIKTVIVRPDQEQVALVWAASVQLDGSGFVTELASVRHAVQWRSNR